MAATRNHATEYHAIEIKGITDTQRWFATRNFHGDVIRQNEATKKSYASRGLMPPCTR